MSEAFEEEVVILVKAVPRVGSKHGETVCCAGVTLTGQWRRLYPIRFRRLEEESRFTRWSLVKYRASVPKDDTRVESRRVHEESIRVGGKYPPIKRADFLAPLIRQSTEDAAARGESLTILRPLAFQFRAKPMDPAAHDALKRRYANAARQGSFLDRELIAFDPPKFHFRLSFQDREGGWHHHQCEDWETIAAFRKWSLRYGDASAIERLTAKYEEYFRRGVVLAMGTVTKRPRQWLLLGIIRLDEPTGQLSLL